MTTLPFLKKKSLKNIYRYEKTLFCARFDMSVKIELVTFLGRGMRVVNVVFNASFISSPFILLCLNSIKSCTLSILRIGLQF